MAEEDVEALRHTDKAKQRCVCDRLERYRTSGANGSGNYLRLTTTLPSTPCRDRTTAVLSQHSLRSGGRLSNVNNALSLFRHTAQAALDQHAAIVEDRMRHRGDMGVDALEIPQDIQMQRTGLQALRAPVAQAGDMTLSP